MNWKVEYNPVGHPERVETATNETLSDMKSGEIANLYNELKLIGSEIIAELRKRGFDA